MRACVRPCACLLPFPPSPEISSTTQLKLCALSHNECGPELSRVARDLRHRTLQHTNTISVAVDVRSGKIHRCGYRSYLRPSKAPTSNLAPSSCALPIARAGSYPSGADPPVCILHSRVCRLVLCVLRLSTRWLASWIDLVGFGFRIRAQEKMGLGGRILLKADNASFGYPIKWVERSHTHFRESASGRSSPLSR